MTEFTDARALIGRQLLGAWEFWAKDDEARAAVAFELEGGVLVAWADPDSDAIELEVLDRVDAWHCSSWPRDMLTCERAGRPIRELVGRALSDLWLCTSSEDHHDGVDVALGDLLFPSIKLLVAGSELHVLAIEKVHH